MGRGEGGLVGCVQCRGLGGRASPSGVYPAGGLRGSFDWGGGRGACGLCPGSSAWGLVGCIQSREIGARASCLPRFILLLSFIDTVLVVSNLDIVYDCPL